MTAEELEQIAHLAYLNTSSEHKEKLTKEISDIMNFVEQLRAVDTQGISPLFHPLTLQQPLRSDVVTEEDCSAQLEALAPLFEEQMYLVPQVLEDK